MAAAYNVWRFAVLDVRAYATLLGMLSCFASGPELVGVEAPAFMRGKERFSAPGGLSVPICALALVAAMKRGPFMVRGSHASYQGTTLDGPKRTQQRFGLYRLRKNSALYQGTTSVGPYTIGNMSGFRGYGKTLIRV